MLKKSLALTISGLLCAVSHGNAAPSPDELQEVVVTAQRKEDSLQNIPVAVSVLNSQQLESLGVTSVDSLSNGIIPSLRVMTVGNPSSTLVMAIRGNGPVDVQPYTRAQTVAVYLDEIYLGRPQGLTMELSDLERVEVLRGPQGTLFGRNTTSGAVRLITKKPTGEFGVDQTVGFGNYNLIRSITRVNLSEFSGVKVKLDYLHTKRDGWVENDAPGQSDYNALNHNGGKLTVEYSPVDRLQFGLQVDNSRVADTNSYYQDYRDYIGLIGNEPHRDTKVRAPFPNKPSYVYQTGAAFSAGWDVTENLSFKSYTGYRRLKENSYTSFGASIYYNGCINMTEDRERQFTQEFQLLGNTDSLNYVAGAYYFDGHGTQDIILRFAQDQLLNPIDPPIDLGVPERYVTATSKSKAAYTQMTWTPNILDQKLHLTAGVRYTRDESDGGRTEVGYIPFDLDYNHWDTTFIVDYSWQQNLSTYLKRSTGFRAGGVNPRSEIFTPFGPEKVTTWELGMKSEFLDHRLRLNADVFHTQYDGLQYDFSSPTTLNINNTETFNASDVVTVKGVELDLTAVPIDGLTLGLSYTYLHDNMGMQPNPVTGFPQEFEMPQTPRHAGSITFDYTFQPLPMGVITAHLDAQSSSGYAHQSTDTQQQSGYTIFNARLSLGNLEVANGQASVSLWVKNITNAAYPAFAFPLAEPPIALIRTWNEPRTFGVEGNYRF